MGLIPSDHGVNRFGELGNIAKRVFVDGAAYFF